MTVAAVKFARGSFDVTVNAISVDDAFAEKLFIITPPTAKQNQASGQQTTKIVSLLRLTRTIVMTCMLTGTATKTAKTVKDELISIIRGGETAGDAVTLTYDGDTITGIIEKMAFAHKPSDEGDVSTDKVAFQDYVKYTLQITFIEGAPV